MRRRGAVAGLVAVEAQHSVLAAAVLAYPGEETPLRKDLASEAGERGGDGVLSLLRKAEDWDA